MTVLKTYLEASAHKAPPKRRGESREMLSSRPVVCLNLRWMDVKQLGSQGWATGEAVFRPAHCFEVHCMVIRVPAARLPTFGHKFVEFYYFWQQGTIFLA